MKCIPANTSTSILQIKFNYVTMDVFFEHIKQIVPTTLWNWHAWMVSVFQSTFCVMAGETVKMAQMKHSFVVSLFMIYMYICICIKSSLVHQYLHTASVGYKYLLVPCIFYFGTHVLKHWHAKYIDGRTWFNIDSVKCSIMCDLYNGQPPIVCIILSRYVTGGV